MHTISSFTIPLVFPSLLACLLAEEKQRDYKRDWGGRKEENARERGKEEGKEGGRGEEDTKFTVIKLEIIRAESMLQMTRVFSRCFHLHILLHSHRTFLLLLLPHFSISSCVCLAIFSSVCVSLSHSRSLSLSRVLFLGRRDLSENTAKVEQNKMAGISFFWWTCGSGDLNFFLFFWEFGRGGGGGRMCPGIYFFNFVM